MIHWWRKLPKAQCIVATQDESEASTVATIASALSVATVARLRQVHGERVVVMQRSEDAGGEPAEGDALVCTYPSRAAAVLTADCVPLLLASRAMPAVAAVHVGWRGAAAGIVERTLQTLGELGVRASDIFAIMGPAAGGCCYEVGPEVVSALGGQDRGASWLLRGRGERPHVDLRTWVGAALERHGVASDRVESLGPCTICGSTWPSYRREGRSAGRIWSAVALATSA